MSSPVTNAPTLVVGHRNPDMDAIAAAVGFAYVLDTLGPDRYVAGRLGDLNPQTNFAIDHFKASAPDLIASVAPRVRDVTKSIAALHADQPIRAAQHFPVAVVDAENKPIALLTGAEVAAALTSAFGNTAKMDSALNAVLDTVIRAVPITLNADDTIKDVTQNVLRADTVTFIVIDADGHYVGLCQKADLFVPTRRKVALVDHNEAGQSVPGLEEADLVEVLDHHRLGNPHTILPIRFYVDPVGSSSTLVAERANAAGIPLPAPIAGLLLSGILSDTLVFKSPTTTPRDQKAAEALGVMAGLSDMAAIEQYGTALLASGAGLSSKSTDEIVNSDLKEYEANGNTAGVVQVEVANYDELPGRLADLQAALEKKLADHHYSLALLMVTDIIESSSRLVVAGSPTMIAALPYNRLPDGTFDAPGMVSRKKQMLPVVLDVLARG